ncbi:MAG: hypothetical protein U0Q16_03175 [Bryobacteraceae bacterium]
MKRFAVTIALVASAVLWLAPAVSAQPNTQVASVLVQATSKLAKFRVDGVEYGSAASFLWPAGSKHTLEFQGLRDGQQYANVGRSRFTFGSWADNLGIMNSSSPVVTVTADPRVTGYTLTVNAEHEVQLVWYDGPAQPASATGCSLPGVAPPPQVRVGVVFVSGNCYWNNTIVWITEGTFNLQAVPYPGYVFLGWLADTRPSDAFLRTFTVTGPLVLVPRFAPAKRVNFRTIPAGLYIRLDREEVRTTEIEPCEPNNLLPVAAPPGIKQPCIGEFDLIPGSSHVVGAPSPQTDKFGKVWVFDGYTNGFQNNSVFNVPNEIYPEITMVAKFVRGISTTVISKPVGLKLSVNGRDNWSTPYFVFAPGNKVTIAAAAEQVDAKGRKYVFKRWSNGGAAAQEVVVPENPDKTFYLEAEYELLSQVVVRSNPLGATITVDGTPCLTPCRIDRQDGKEALIDAPPNNQLSDLQRFEWDSWSNGGPRAQTIAVKGPEPAYLTVNMRTAFKLQLAVDPPEGARLRVEPESPDGFYPADSYVTITAEAKPGFRFRRWDYDLSGTTASGTISMARSRSVVARLDKVPYISPTGVRNAAGGEEGAVAAGSLVSISGANLAPYYEAGPSGPILAQAIAGVSVTIGNRILPLLFVSPEQINAQLPRDLAPGEYELRVIRAGQQDTAAKFTLVRSAPGLFAERADGQSFAKALHEDGSAITPDSPAKLGETVTVLGTGFGAYQFSHPDGFILPAAFPLVLPAEVGLGETTLQPKWAGGVAGQVGIDSARFQIPEQFPEGIPAKVDITVRIDGRKSNAVSLPLALPPAPADSPAQQ